MKKPFLIEILINSDNGILSAAKSRCLTEHHQASLLSLRKTIATSYSHIKSIYALHDVHSTGDKKNNIVSSSP